MPAPIDATAAHPAVRSSRGLGEGPAYLRIRDELRARILGGAYPADAPLPSQQRLSKEFGVTLMTLRHAVRLLGQEGLLVTRHGTGTFPVPRRFAYSIGPLRSLAQEMADQGRALDTRVLHSAERGAPPAVAAALGLAAGAPVVLLERVRSVDGVPAVFQRSYLPPALGRRAVACDLNHRSLYEVLAVELGVVVARASERLAPIVLGPAEARLLEQAPGSAAMLSERTTFDHADHPVLADEAFMPGSLLHLAAERRTNDMSIRYELRPGAAPAPRSAP
jgi:GntR family transcriptional regulator